MKKAVLLIILLLLSLIFHNEVMSGTTSGLLLWYRTLIPTLLPFIMITNALFETHSYDYIADFIQNQSYIKYIFIAIIMGNLCGYPIGAKILNDFVVSGIISPDIANSFLSFSSQANPMFLIGFVYPILPKNSLSLPAFLLLIYIPHIALYYLYFKYRQNFKNTHICPKATLTNQKDTDISVTFLEAVNTMVLIGIYVIIFSIILEIALPLLHTDLSKCILAFLEITNGLTLISSLSISKLMITCIITSLSAFGGLCTAFQVKCVLNYKGATIKKYLRDKIIISTGTFILTMLYLKKL